MAYNFLTLVNDVNGRLNEVPLTSTTFANAIGYYSLAKEAVNSSIRKINQEQFEWPFNHVTQEDTLVAGTVRYAFQADCKTVDMDSFRIKRNNSLNVESKKLTLISYEEYLERFVDAEYDTTEGNRAVPYYVFRTPSLQYGVYPSPDKAYELVYEYYSVPSELTLHSDVPTIPEQFRHVIVDGAMYHVYLFRGDLNSAELSNQRFMAGISDMKTLLINRYEYLRSTVVLRN